jgi:ATP-dependent RNA helicase DeaD
VSAFGDLGLRSELSGAAEAAGFDVPTSLQRASVPVLRRGGNTVLIAGSGSGATTAWILGVLDRLAGEAVTEAESAGPDAPRALVLTTTEERATRIARTVLTLSGGLDLSVRAVAPAWSGQGGSAVLVAPLSTAVRAIRESALKLAGVEVVVLDHLSALMESPDGASFGDVLAAIPGSAQRIVVTPRWSKEIERFAEAHARRAVTIPPRQADPQMAKPPVPQGTVSYVIASATEKPDALARLLRRKRSHPPTLTARSTRRARWFANELRARGFRIDAANGDSDAWIAAQDGAEGALIAADVPFDARALASLDLDNGVIVIEPGELAHLQSIAAEAGVTLQPVGGRPAKGATAKYLEEIRTAIRELDVDANVALLDPLFDEYPAAEIAAALSALLRSARSADTRKPEPAEDRPMSFVRLFVSAGSKDGIRPGDLVGAITGEASVPGDHVGKIEMRDTFSVVEIASDSADKVIRALNGTTMRGRSLRVDFDRKQAAPVSRQAGSPRTHRS